ncbi:MAG TPA: hypothetical protein VKI62_10020 [Bacteroidota bacterium]|nr:hypothetical protein [Bacteroidota bacterium]
MFDWFKKQYPNTVADYDWVVARFHKLRGEIERASIEEQYTFSIFLVLYWKDFIGTHGSPMAFADLLRNEQIAYFKEMMSLRAILFEQMDFKKAIPLEMLTMFLSAIINGDDFFEQEVARIFDTYARKGWDLVGAIGNGRAN